MRESWQLHNAAVRVQLLCDLIESSTSCTSAISNHASSPSAATSSMMMSFPAPILPLTGGRGDSLDRLDVRSTAYYDPLSASSIDYGPYSQPSSPSSDYSPLPDCPPPPPPPHPGDSTLDNNPPPPEYSFRDPAGRQRSTTFQRNSVLMKPLSKCTPTSVWGYYRDDLDLLPRNRRGGGDGGRSYSAYRSYGAIAQLPIDRDLITFDLLAGVMPRSV